MSCLAKLAMVDAHVSEPPKEVFFVVGVTDGLVGDGILICWGITSSSAIATITVSTIAITILVIAASSTTSIAIATCIVAR